MATIKELSERCGVSVSTVSKALNGYQDISEVTKQRIITEAKLMGYFPDANARALKMKKTYNIGVLFSTLQRHGLRNEHFAYILAAFTEAAVARGYDISFIEHNIGKKKMTYLEHCRNKSFDGICIICAEFTNAEVLELANSDFPMVIVDHPFGNAISVLSDNVGGMCELTQYIIDKGHRKIAYIYGNKSTVTHNRLVSFYNTLSMNDIGMPPNEYVVEGIYRGVDVADKLATQLLELPDPPTCIIAPDDFAALGVINAAHRKKLRIPEDISVAGYDGISVSSCIHPKLTTVKQDTDKIGSEAANKLIDLIEMPDSTLHETIYLEPLFMSGESVGDVPKR